MGIIGSGVDFAVNHPVITGGALVTGGIATRGAPQARSHYRQAMSQTNQMHEDAGTPMNFEAIKNAQFQRYDAFAKVASSRAAMQVKMAAFGSKDSGGGNKGFGLTADIAKGLTKGVLDSAVTRMITKPLEKAWEIIDKKVYVEPRQKNVLKQVIQSDPMLARMMETNPELVAEAFKTVRTYAPSLTTDASALKGFLRQIAITGIVDPATIRMLAETEKFVRASRGQIGSNV